MSLGTDTTVFNITDILKPPFHLGNLFIAALGETAHHLRETELDYKLLGIPQYRAIGNNKISISLFKAR